MPGQHAGTPQPPSVLICFDCCSLIIEDNKVRTFLSCRVCCLSLWPRLSEAGVPLDQLSSFQGPERQAMVATGARTEEDALKSHLSTLHIISTFCEALLTLRHQQALIE